MILVHQLLDLDDILCQIMDRMRWSKSGGTSPPDHARHLPRRFATVVLAAGAAVAGAVPADAVSAVPASAVPASVVPADSGPAPICWPAPVICVPQTWYVATSVVINDGLLQLLPTSVEVNTTSASTTLDQTVTVTGSLTASVTAPSRSVRRSSRPPEAATARPSSPPGSGCPGPGR